MCGGGGWVVVVVVILGLLHLSPASAFNKRESFGDLDGSDWKLCPLFLETNSFTKENMPFLGVGVLSRASNFLNRTSARETWMKAPSIDGPKPTVVVRFFITLPSDPVVLAALHEESAQYKDIVIVNVPEGYANLPWQTLAMARHFSVGPQYILKSDDDNYVRPDKVVNYLKGLKRNPDRPLYCGWTTEGAHPLRSGKWAVSEELYPEELYPIWTGGPMHLFSASLARAVIAEDKGERLRIIPLEDISLALWVDRIRSKGVDVEIINERSFYRQRTCDSRAFNFLVEEGRPLSLNSTQVFYELRARELAQVYFCPPHTTLPEIGVKGRQRGVKTAEEKESEARVQLASLENQLLTAPPRSEAAFKAKIETTKSNIEGLAAATVTARNDLTKAEAELLRLWEKEPTSRQYFHPASEGILPPVATWPGSPPTPAPSQPSPPPTPAPSQPSPPPTPAPSQPSSPPPSSPPPTPAKSTGSRRTGPALVVYHDVEDFSGYHNTLYARAGPVKGCPQTTPPCEITMDKSRVAEADLVLFATDTEFYSHKAPTLPPNVNGVPYVAILREAIPLFPVRNWAKYTHRMTYRRSDSAVVFGYVPSPSSLLSEAQSVFYRDRTPAPGDGHIAFVSRACGNTSPDGRPLDGRARRTAFVQELGTFMQVDSYGRCANNKAWPEGHVRSKLEVMRRHKFCIAIENTIDDDYHTEKLWDCLASGSVPVYRGAKTVYDWVPPNSIVNIDDFPDTASLAHHLKSLIADEASYEAKRAWINNPPADWLAFLEANTMVTAHCRLCEFAVAQRSS